MIKNSKNNNDDSYDQQIEHLFTFGTKSKKTENEKKPETLDESEIENYSHILYSIEFATALHYVENPDTTDKILLKELTSLVRRYDNGQSNVESNIVKKAKTSKLPMQIQDQQR